MLNQDNKMLHSHECNCLGWSPILAGAFTAIGLAFLLNLFSVAIGLTAFTTNSTGAQTLVMGGLIGTAIGIIVSMFVAGWLSGYLGIRHCTKRHIGALYGFLTWCVALIISIFLASYAQQYVSFYSHFISGVGEGTLNMNNAGMSNIAIVANNQGTKTMMISTYIIFILFFLGAFAASLGGHCGMRHVCREENL